MANAMVTLCDMLDSAARDAEDCGDLGDATDPCARRVELLFANRRSRERDVRVRGCGAASALSARRGLLAAHVETQSREGSVRIAKERRNRLTTAWRGGRSLGRHALGIY